MNKNEIEKGMNAAVDLVTWLDQRIAQQVEHQVELRLEREREYWRGAISALLVKEVAELVWTSHDKMIDRVQQMLDRAEAKLNEPMHRFGDDTPPSKH